MKALAPLRVLLPFAVVVAAWWGLKVQAHVPDTLLVAPPAVWASFVYLLTHGILAEYASASLRMIGTAAVISCVIGVPLGFAVGTNRYAARALEGTLRFLQGIWESPGCHWRFCGLGLAARRP